MNSLDDPIVALATPPGVGGLAVIRVSGVGSVQRVAPFIQSAKPVTGLPSHQVQYGHFKTGDGRLLDEVLVTCFLAPKSFTTQDTVEISCHGGPVVVQSIIAELTSSGIRHAEPGEFTKRAFLFGRIDLAQAESVADLIHSSSTLSQQSSLFQLSGIYSDRLKKIRKDLIDYIALLELELDFSDEDIEFASRQKLIVQLDSIIEFISRITSTYLTGRFIREGARIVIAGKPNAGKSTLLNLLLGHDRAIVSPIPGTTRDTIEETLNIEGIPFRIIDTAGIRETEDSVEKIGVERTLDSIRRANILIYIFDIGLGLDQTEHDFLKQVKSANPEIVILKAGNKSDLAGMKNEGNDVIPISALKDDGISDLKHAIVSKVLGNKSLNEASESVTNGRHYQALTLALEAVKSGRTGVVEGISQDFISADIRHAINQIGEITGEVTTDEILNTIFANFCIGK